MDFFERQQLARKNTRLLLVYFALAVILTIVAVYFVTMVGMSYYHADHRLADFSWWDINVAIGVALIVGFIIALGTSVRIFQLAQGGRVVATELGGKPLNPLTTNPDERKLLNIVEEMSIASGTAMPQVFVMPEEQGINAFAAGHKIADTAVSVTRGAMEKLSRDELQGVIGHEFSHILNGDMLLNMRLSCLTFGILFISLTGKQLFLLPLRARVSGGGSGKKGGGGAIILGILAVGAALCVIGSIGYFFTRLIQAAVCRQREFLADASAVQFTRNPSGIASALAKINRFEWSSELHTPQAAKASHFLFASGSNDIWEKMFSTHPPLKERITAIDPNFDFESIKRKADANDENTTAPAIPPRQDTQLAAALGLNVAQFLNQNAAPEHLAIAADIYQSLPPELLQAGREIFGAKAVVYGLLLLAPGAELRQRQLDILNANGENAVAGEADKFMPAMQSLDPNQHFSLLNLVIPTLRHLSPAQYAAFIQTVDQLIAADQQINLFEYGLKKILHHQLDEFFRLSPPSRTKYFTLLPLLPAATTLIANLAYSGSSEQAEVDTAFAKGTAQLNITGQQFTLPGEQIHNLDSFDQALDEVALATPLIKKNILFACATTVMADNQALPEEIEVLRAVAAVLDCPIPPFVGKS